MTHIQDPGESILELKSRDTIEHIQRSIVIAAVDALDEAYSVLRNELSDWLTTSTGRDLEPGNLTKLAHDLASAAHDGLSEAGQLARILPASHGKVVGLSDEGQVSISALVVLSLALQRFATLASIGSRVLLIAAVRS